MNIPIIRFALIDAFPFAGRRIGQRSWWRFSGCAGNAFGGSERNVYHFGNDVEKREGQKFRTIFIFAVEFVVLIELKKLVNVSSKFLWRRSNRIQFGFGWGGSGRKLIIHTIKDGEIFMERRHKKRKRRKCSLGERNEYNLYKLNLQSLRIDVLLAIAQILSLWRMNLIHVTNRL